MLVKRKKNYQNFAIPKLKYTIRVNRYISQVCS